MTNSAELASSPQANSWSAQLDVPLAAALKACNVRVEPIDPATLKLCAVPLSQYFNKLRTNLLIHRTRQQIRAYVDCDLAYSGPHGAIREALQGPHQRKWKLLGVNIPPGSVGQVIRSTLATLGSPLLDILQVHLQESSQAALGESPLPPNSILATETRAVEASELSAAFRSSVHKPLARQLSRELVRQPPRCGMVWGASGTGKRHLLRTTAHFLFHQGTMSQVRHLSAARLTCGRVFPAERDGVLSALLDELVKRPQLLLIDYLDLGISGTRAGFSLLAAALDQGARILATIHDEHFLKDVKEIPFLARRVMPFKAPRFNSDETLRVLKSIARNSGREVEPAALLAVVELSQRRGDCQPAAAIDLLRTVLAGANGAVRKPITPDDVTSVLESNWPL